MMTLPLPAPLGPNLTSSETTLYSAPAAVVSLPFLGPPRLLSQTIPLMTRAWCRVWVPSSSPPLTYDIPHSLHDCKSGRCVSCV